MASVIQRKNETLLFLFKNNIILINFKIQANLSLSMLTNFLFLSLTVEMNKLERLSLASVFRLA
jgi:hypothetical protein